MHFSTTALTFCLLAAPILSQTFESLDELPDCAKTCLKRVCSITDKMDSNACVCNKDGCFSDCVKWILALLMMIRMRTLIVSVPRLL
jgi:hypothetical protein